MQPSEIVILITIGAYLLLMLLVGLKFSKTNHSVRDFYLGGRKLGPLVTAMSAEASDMSSWLLMGLPGVAYLSGVCDAFWTAVGLAVGTWLNWWLVARRIRRYSHHIDAITIPQFFSRRYGDRKNVLTCLAALVIVVFFVPYTASGFAACGKLFSALFGVDYLTAMILCAVIIVAYTSLGGFLAASTTDLIQSVVMTVALIAIMGWGVWMAGGMEAVIQNAQALPGYLSLTETHDAASGGSQGYGFLTIVSTLAWGLGYFGMPHILLRFMAIENEKKLSLSRRVATVWVVISMTVAILIGMIGLTMSQNGTLDMLSGNGSETILVHMAQLLAKWGPLAAVLAGVVLAGILAATMSTADSQLLAAASSVSQNLLTEFGHIRLREKTNVLIARGAVLLISVVAIWIARDPDSSVFQIVSFAWAGFGATFGPVILMALFWRRSNRQGALAAMLTGGVMVFVWKYVLRPLGGAWDIYELLPAFLLALLAGVLVSLLTKAPETAITDEFDEVKRSLS